MTAYYSEFAGTTVLVTGAGAGIGRTIAHAFLEHGARVAGLDIDEQGLAATFGGASLPEVCAVKCDVSDEGQLRFAFEAVVGALGAPSILINNAGVGVAAPFEEISAASWRKALALNLDHQFLLSQLAVPHMRRLGRGSIVNLSSHAWMKMAPNLSGYHAAKAGVVGLTRGLAREVGGDMIRVNAIAPGRVFTEKVQAEFLTPEYEAETRRLQCLPDLILPRDIADAALFLSSENARMITGQTIIVDGGWV